jgi:hypothetical protein
VIARDDCLSQGRKIQRLHQGRRNSRRRIVEWLAATESAIFQDHLIREIQRQPVMLTTIEFCLHAGTIVLVGLGEQEMCRSIPRPARGGHFAALEEPGLLAQDVREFFHELRD